VCSDGCVAVGRCGGPGRGRCHTAVRMSGAERAARKIPASGAAGEHSNTLVSHPQRSILYLTGRAHGTDRWTRAAEVIVIGQPACTEITSQRLHVSQRPPAGPSKRYKAGRRKERSCVHSRGKLDCTHTTHLDSPPFCVAGKEQQTDARGAINLDIRCMTRAVHAWILRIAPSSHEESAGLPNLPCACRAR
jgi:hypothetical protein